MKTHVKKVETEEGMGHEDLEDSLPIKPAQPERGATPLNKIICESMVNDSLEVGQKISESSIHSSIEAIAYPNCRPFCVQPMTDSD